MPTITDPETRTRLAQLGCLSEESLNTTAFARLCAERLEAAHIATGLDDIAAVETTAGGIVSAILGRSDDEVIEAAKLLLSASTEGRVQKLLTDGHYLCSRRAEIEVDIEGERQTIRVSTRFLSADPDVLQRYVLGPQLKKVDAAGRRATAVAELVQHRQPAMAPRVRSYLQELKVTWQKTLPGLNDEEDES